MDTYEKKYNEAQMRADEAVQKGCLDKAIFDEIFPPEESEDERIRKWIIEEFKIHYDFESPSLNPMVEKALAWLEKQKENPKNADSIPADCVSSAKCEDRSPKHSDSDGIDIRDTPAYWRGWDDAMKQKEQKPAEWSEVELEFRGEKVTVKRPFYRDDKGRGYSTAELDEGVAWNALRAWCEKKGISLYDLYPKSEWSEEDEDMLNCCISSIEEAKENRYAYKETDGDTSYDREIAFLKSLRPQKLDASKLENFDPVEVLNRIKTEWPMAWEKVVGKQEWSEEDEKIMQTMIKEGDLKPSEIAWLKSLRPSWKPSEEQMEALAYAIQILDDGLSPKAAKAGEELEGIREHFKKL